MKIITPKMVLLVALVCTMVLRQAWASPVIYDLTGDPNLGLIYGGQTLARVTLTDITGGVSFSVEALIPGTRISGFGFNFLNDVAPTGFNGLPTNWVADVDVNKQGGFGGGFGKFDVDVHDSGQTNWLSPLTFSVTGGTVTDYIALSYKSGQPPNEGNSLFAAHVTNMNTAEWGTCSAADNDSGNCVALTGNAGIGTQVVVPVPAAFWLFGSGLLGMAAISRRKRSS
jgi:hypothetical protein